MDDLPDWLKHIDIRAHKHKGRRWIEDRPAIDVLREQRKPAIPTDCVVADLGARRDPRHPDCLCTVTGEIRHRISGLVVVKNHHQVMLVKRDVNPK